VVIPDPGARGQGVGVAFVLDEDPGEAAPHPAPVHADTRRPPAAQAHAAAHEAPAPTPAAAAGADGGLRPALTPAPLPEMRPIDAVPVVDTHR
jgi:hypothetical protein